MTKTLAITVDQLDDYLLAEDVTDVRIVNDYSGVAMFGDRCFGLVGTEPAIVRALFVLGHHVGYLLGSGNRDDQLVDLYDELIGKRCRTDSMGLHEMIFYWEHIQLKDDASNVLPR